MLFNKFVTSEDWCKYNHGYLLSKKNLFFVGILKATKEKSRIRIRNPVVRLRGSGPYQNIMDPEQDNQGG